MQPCPLCLFPLYLACICQLNFLSSQNRDPGQFIATQTGPILAAKGECPQDQFSLPNLALLGPLLAREDLLLQPKSARGTQHLCVGPVPSLLPLLLLLSPQPPTHPSRYSAMIELCCLGACISHKRAIRSRDKISFALGGRCREVWLKTVKSVSSNTDFLPMLGLSPYFIL